VDVVIQGMTREFQETHGLTSLPASEAFEAFAAYCVLSSFHDGPFNPDSFRTGGGNDLGIDAFGILVNGELLHDAEDVSRVAEENRQLVVDVVLIQAKTSAGFDTKVISDLADNLTHVTGGGELPYAASDDVVNICRCLAAVYRNIGKLEGRLPHLHVRYVTTGTQVADMILRKAAVARNKLLALSRFDDVTFTCVNQPELRRLHRQATTKATAKISMSRRVILPKAPDVKQAVQGLLPAEDLVQDVLTDSAGRLRKSVFHENVRDFQGYLGVNAKIRETLQDRELHELFALLHNGITVVTRKMLPVGDEIHLEDFQIVNGCQTCHVLFDERENLTKQVHLTVRIVETQNEDVISRIVASTNRQTVISEEDLSVREEFHRLLEDYFHHSRAPQHRLYYERRSKQYSDRKEVEKTRVIGRSQLTRAYLAMFLGEPSGVGHYKSLLESRGAELFKAGQQPVFYYAAAATLYRLEWLIRNRRIDKAYSTARYHLLAAAKLKLLGTGSVEHSPRSAERSCDPLLKVIWDANESERLFTELLGPLERAMRDEPGSVPPGEMVRTRRFAERFKKEVLGS
jgi:hypothetical protein